MRVCHFVASVGLGRGDVFVDLCNALSESAEVWIVAPFGAKFGASLDERVKLIEYKSQNTRFNPFLFFELLQIFKEINPDLVHTHFAKATEMFQLLNKVLKLPWCATKHNPRTGRIYNRIDNVIAVSEVVAKTIEHDRVTVIHNGIKPVKIDIVDVEKEKKGVFKILAVGRLEKVKAFDRLIEECAKLDFDYRLQIVGDGPEKASLAHFSKLLGVSDKVSFLGFREDVPSLMSLADVVVVCSHSEGFSLVILEALFYGNLLLSRNVGIAGRILPEKLIVVDFAISEKLKDAYENYACFKKEFSAVSDEQKPYYHIKNNADEHLRFYEKINES